jgi:hypothetical protein
MNKRTMLRHTIILLALAVPLVLAGCGRDKEGTARYSVSVTNLTSSQPLAPPAVIMHAGGYSAWQVGAAASPGVERLAEGGDPALLIAEATAAGARETASGSAPVPPGGSETFTLTVKHSRDLRLTTASMLVNTNDGFAGTAGALIGDLAKGEVRTVTSFVYDAGTEPNTETAATIPGPAGGGEGFNAAREPRNFVAMHSGVVTHDDGLASSVLDESHRFQAPVVRIVITRTQ